MCVCAKIRELRTVLNTVTAHYRCINTVTLPLPRITLHHRNGTVRCNYKQLHLSQWFQETILCFSSLQHALLRTGSRLQKNLHWSK